MFQRPSPRTTTPERERAITRRAWVILSIAAALYLAALLPNLWPAVQATADVIGIR